MSGTCSVAGCDNPVNRGKGCARGMCHTHYARWSRARRRGVVADLSTPIRKYRYGPWARIVEAAIALADAEDDAAFELAKKRLRGAVSAWRPDEDTAQKERSA